VSACPVCETYGSRHGDIDRAGDRHHKALARIREREAEGLEVTQLSTIPAQLVRESERTATLMGFSA
jgi:hypothetical protein